MIKQIKKMKKLCQIQIEIIILSLLAKKITRYLVFKKTLFQL
jgi:hypothetical protein